MAHGFTAIAETEVSEHRAVLRRCTHEATGLDFVHLRADSEESAFGFIFRTPALDDRGTSHIV
jgi:Zn-dependent M16 (insulinase) family peptidase